VYLLANNTPVTQIKCKKLSTFHPVPPKQGFTKMWYSSSSCRLNQQWQIFLAVNSAGVKICHFYQKEQVAGNIVQPAITCS